MLIAGRYAGTVWGLLTVAALAVVAVAAAGGVDFPIHVDPSVVAARRFEVAIAIAVAMLGVALVYDSVRHRALHERNEALDQAALADQGRIESEARFRTLTENASDVVTEWDARAARIPSGDGEIPSTSRKKSCAVGG